MRPGASGVKQSIHLNPFQELGLLVSSAALFFLAFPNPLNTWGFGPLAFFALLPLLILVNRTSWPRLMAFGPLSGFLFYLLFNHWLGAYHPLAIFIVPSIMAVEFLVLALSLRLAHDLLPRAGWLVQICMWVSFEYLKTQGFLGYPYGILGYSQYLFLPLARLSSLTGIWGVSTVVVWPSCYLAWLASKENFDLPALWQGLRHGFAPLALWAAALVAALVYGQSQIVDYSALPSKRMVLVQQNIDPWIGGTAAYARNLDALIRQTDRALADSKGVDMVIWSETCFIPAIQWHDKYREDPERYALVKTLKDYLAGLTVPVVLGNGEAEAWSDGSGQRLRRDYNAVLVFQGREQTASYRKMRLVPFTESFPYQETFPWLYQLLVANDTSFWTAGKDYVILEAAGLRFASPICFEDSFGYISRDFFNLGAQMLVNLSNDSWSKSVPAAMQHLAMASFRAMENQRTVVRSTNGGMSALIDPNGQIVRMNQAFTESWIVVDAPVYTNGQTVYRRWGDWFAMCAMVSAAGGLLAGALARLRRVILAHRRKTD